MRKIRIKNDGQPAYMTKVTDAETGAPIECVMNLELVIAGSSRSRASRRAIPRAILTIGFPIIDIIADAEIKEVCPVCGKPKEDEQI